MTNSNEISLTPLKIIDAEMSFCIQTAQDGKLLSNGGICTAAGNQTP